MNKKEWLKLPEANKEFIVKAFNTYEDIRELKDRELIKEYKRLENAYEDKEIDKEEYALRMVLTNIKHSYDLADVSKEERAEAFILTSSKCNFINKRHIFHGGCLSCAVPQEQSILTCFRCSTFNEDMPRELYRKDKYEIPETKTT